MTNNESVKKYQSKLTTIRVRILAQNDELNIPDYLQLMRNRAKELGIVNQKGKNKDDGSINAYILHLIEQDLGIDMIKNVSDTKNKTV